jgi:hypothetical protein
MTSRGLLPCTGAAALLTLTAIATPPALAQTETPAPAPEATPAPVPVTADAPAPAPVLAAAAPMAPPPPTVTTTPAPAPAPAPAVPPPPYSLPWQLRPAAVGNVVRLDTSVGFYRTPPTATAPAVTGGSTVASMLLATYKVTPWLAPLVRLGVVQNDNPGPMMGSGSAFVNPILGLTGGWKLSPDFRMSAVLAGTLPIGQGGDKPAGASTSAAAVAKGIPVRSAMDNAMFAVNYFTALGGADVAYVAHKLTVQAEVTLLQLFRTRNELCEGGMAKCAAESTRTNATAGLHVGYFIIPLLSLGTELRYQRWLSTPAAVKMDPAARDNVTVAIGPRFHFKLGSSTWLRPGISYAAYLDKPLTKSRYSIIQVDLPLAF